MNYKISKYSFISLKNSDWKLGGGWNNGICALSGKTYKKNSPILWKPNAVSEGHGITVLLEEYLKIPQIKNYIERAKEIKLDLNLQETNPWAFHCSK